MKKLCPIYSAARQISDKYSSDYLECFGRECEWWVPDDGDRRVSNMCAIKAIAQVPKYKGK